MIDLPFWSTLTLELDALRPSTNHDQSSGTTPLTSAEAKGSGKLITRLLASGL